MINTEQIMYLKSIVNDRTWNISEIHPAFMVEIQQCKINNRNAYIYGASVHAYSLVRYLQNEGIICKAVIDMDESKEGDRIYDVEIFSPSSCSIGLDKKAFVFIVILKTVIK